MRIIATFAIPNQKLLLSLFDMFGKKLDLHVRNLLFLAK